MAELTGKAISFASGAVRLGGTLFVPKAASSTGMSGAIVLHGFPNPVVGAERAGVAYASLAGRIAEELDWLTMGVTYRGCGTSDGQFSLAGWREDVLAAVTELQKRGDLKKIFLVGFGTGAALAICAAADYPKIDGVVAVSPPADFADWADDPHQLLAHCRQLGLITDPDFPADFDSWAAELRTSGAADHALEIPPRPMLLLHGADDEIVPVFDARVIADAHTNAELRVLEGAGHGLRFDPRAIAILLGWLDRHS